MSSIKYVRRTRAVSNLHSGAVLFDNTEISSTAVKRVARSFWLRFHNTQGWHGKRPTIVHTEFTK